jgi:hypothetical protein
MNINDELTKKLAQLAADIMAEDNTNNKSDDGEGLDKVQPKAVKKKFADRKDKDIDNDGDVDSSDEYLHKKRKAISANIKNEDAELEEAKRMKYDKVIKKLRDGEWDTSMDVKKRMHLTYTDNNTGKEKTVFVESTDLYNRGGIQITRYAAGKGKLGVQIGTGYQKYIQLTEPQMKTLAQILPKLQRDLRKDLDEEDVRGYNTYAEDSLEEAAGFPESSQGAKQTYDAVVKLSASLRKGSQLNKAVNKRLGGKYDSDFVKMQKAIAVIFDTLEEFDREYQGFDG